MKTIGVLTSGGDAPGMNAAVRAVVRKGLYHGLKVMGVSRGFAGLINGEFQEMTLSSVADIIQRGGTILRTARSEEFLTLEGRATAMEQAGKSGLEGLIVIGGDGSFRGASCLAFMGLPVIGIPGTIDNDIPCTDLTIGYDTAVNTAVDAINKIRDTATSHERVFIIEVMGRRTGHIALAAGLAGGAESILIPEVEFDLDQVVEKLQYGWRRGKLHCIVVMAEGVGTAMEISQGIQKRTNADTRMTILGHIQRGGAPTALDRILASRLGARSVELLLAGESNRMVGIQASQIVSIDINFALRQKKPIDMSLYHLAGVLAT
ncbi:MAG: 6-phosphofructokinase [Bacillota bacterium]